MLKVLFTYIEDLILSMNLCSLHLVYVGFSESIEAVCIQQRLRPACTDVQAELSLYWLHMHQTLFICVLSQTFLVISHDRYCIRV